MATSIDMFAYLAAFVSIILALAVSDLVQSLHRLLRAPTPGEMEFTALIAALTVFGLVNAKIADRSISVKAATPQRPNLTRQTARRRVRSRTDR